jgi:hypothetical protein
VGVHREQGVFAAASISKDGMVLLGAPPRPEATVSIQRWQRDVVQRENERS